jgi:hypothetical protein
MESTVRDGRRAGTGVFLAALIFVLALTAAPAFAAGEAWDKDHHWVSARVGVAKSGATLAPGGNLGFGCGYTWMLGTDVSWGATAGYDVLGKYGAAAEIEIPVTTEFAKHFRMGPAARPYLGLGWGVIYHKTYRTGADQGGWRQGIYLATGANTSIGGAGLVGVDFRYMLEQDTRSNNPTFPNPDASGSVTSLKLSYSYVF